MDGGISTELITRVIFGALIGYIMYRIRSTETKAENSMSRKDVRELIDDKLKPMEVMQRELKEDSKAMNQKLDKLLDHVMISN